MRGYKDRRLTGAREKQDDLIVYLTLIPSSLKALPKTHDMHNQNYLPDEEYRQFLLYQQQQQQQQQAASSGQYSGYWPADQQPNTAGHYPSQHQYPAHQLAASTPGYSQTAGYGGYTGYPQGTSASIGGYGWSQQWDQNNQLPPQPTNPSGGSELHAYVALPSTPQSTIDTYLSIIQLSESEDSSQGSSKSKRAYLCKWPGCPKAGKGESFKSKDNARVHVHKHFGTEKLFECIIPTCRKQFASEDAAKRHRDTTDSKAYTCAVCLTAFARKDYRDWHQSRCRR